MSDADKRVRRSGETGVRMLDVNVQARLEDLDLGILEEMIATHMTQDAAGGA